MANTWIYESPVGKLLLIEKENKLIGLEFLEEDQVICKENSNQKTPLLEACCKQLEEYFNGQRKDFQLPIYAEGTVFQQEVWQALTTISYGETASYKDIAIKIERPKAMRAVGNANHNNPIPIIIPCHRVIGTSGKLIGYGGGLWRKEWLLKHERESFSE